MSLPIPALGELNTCVPQSGALWSLLWYAREASSLPPAPHTIGAALPVIAYEAARRGYALSVGGRIERPKLQCALIAHSGFGKSTSMQVMQGFHREHLARVSGGEDRYVDPWVLAEGSIQGVTEQLAKHHDSRLGSTPGILFHEEFTRLLASRDAVAETLNQVFDGQTVTRHLRTYAKPEQNVAAEVRTITNPAVSAVFATTLAGIETVTTKLQASGGFYSRLLWFTGPPGQLSDNTQADNARTWAHGVWHGWAAHLDALQVIGERKLLDLDPQSKRLLTEMRDEVNVALMKDPDDSTLGARIRGLANAARIAQLFAFSRGALLAHEDDVARAIRLVRCSIGWGEALAERWTAAQIGNSENANIYLAQSPLLTTIANAGEAGVHKGQLYRHLKSKQQLDTALATLIDRGLIVHCKVRLTSGGRPADIYKLAKYAADEYKPN